MTESRIEIDRSDRAAMERFLLSAKRFESLSEEHLERRGKAFAPFQDYFETLGTLVSYIGRDPFKSGRNPFVSANGQEEAVEGEKANEREKAGGLPCTGKQTGPSVWTPFLEQSAYSNTYLNPAYAAGRLGACGPLLSAWYVEFSGLFALLLERRIREAAALLETSLQLFGAAACSDRRVEETALHDIIYSYESDYLEEWIDAACAAKEQTDLVHLPIRALAMMMPDGGEQKQSAQDRGRNAGTLFLLSACPQLLADHRCDFALLQGDRMKAKLLEACAAAMERDPDGTRRFFKRLVVQNYSLQMREADAKTVPSAEALRYTAHQTRVCEALSDGMKLLIAR